MSLLWDNFVSCQLDVAIGPADTELVVVAGQGAALPSPTGDDYAILVLENVSGEKEVVHLTARTDDTLTVTRGEEFTGGYSFPIGSRVELRITAGFLTDFVDGGTF